MQSKALMYGDHYRIKMYYQMKGCRIRLLYMDTDSFLYEIETTTFERDMEDMMSKGGPGFSAKLLGHFKDESAAIAAKLSAKHGRKITGRFRYYIGIAPKLYALVWISDCGEFEEQMRKAKGLPSRVVRGEGFEAYKEQLENPKETFITYPRIMRDRLKTYIGETTRRGICAVDTKTFRLNDDCNVPLGHWRIQHTEVINAPRV